MKTDSRSSYDDSFHIHRVSGTTFHFDNRFKCRVLAATDLIWRLAEFIYAVSIILLGSFIGDNGTGVFSSSSGSSLDETSAYVKNNDGPLANAQRGGSKFLLLLGGGVADKTEHHYEIIDTRVYNFILSPILTFCYFIGFFLQISISFFLFCETSNYGKSTSHQNEIAACTIWSRIAVISLIILALRFFLPYALITYTNITYNVSRVIFKVGGIVLVLIHGRQLKFSHSSSDFEGGSGSSPRNRPEDDYFENDQESEFTTSDTHNSTSFNYNKRFSYSSGKSVFAEVELPPKCPTPIIFQKTGTFGSIDYERAKVHLVQVMAYVEKEMYAAALAELKHAQEYQIGNPHLSTMEPTLQRMINIAEGGGKDYYAILGVPKFSSMEAVRSAYRRKSLRHHPDKHVTEGEQIRKAEENRYLQIREAYETLSDPSKRTYYDEKFKTTRNRLTDLHKVVKTMYDLFNNSLPIRHS